jgi:hypothetical protein
MAASFNMIAQLPRTSIKTNVDTKIDAYIDKDTTQLAAVAERLMYYRFCCCKISTQEVDRQKLYRQVLDAPAAASTPGCQVRFARSSVFLASHFPVVLDRRFAGHI